MNVKLIQARRQRLYKIKQLILRGGPDNNIAHIHTCRLPDGKSNRVGNIIRRDADGAHLFESSCFHLFVLQIVHKVRLHESGRDACYTQPAVRLLA